MQWVVCRQTITSLHLHALCIFAFLEIIQKNVGPEPRFVDRISSAIISSAFVTFVHVKEV